MASKVFIGIDPGKKGAVAVLDGGRVHALRLPFKAQGGVLDALTLSKYLLQFPGALCAIEEQVARPAQGRSGGIMMRGYGSLLAVLEVCEVDYIVVKPKVWQQEMLGSFPRGESKIASAAYCEATFLAAARLLWYQKSGRPHDGVTDALCIAAYRERISPVLP